MKFSFDLKELSLDQNILFQLTHFFSEYSGTTLLPANNSKETSYLFLLPYEQIKISDLKPKENPWDIIEDHIGELNSKSSDPKWVGYLSYEMGSYSDQDKKIDHLLSNYPLAYFQKSALTISLKEKILTISIADDLPKNFKYKAWVEKGIKQDFWEIFLKKLPQLSKTENDLEVVFQSDTLSSYIKKIEAAKKHIKQGDIYQVNLSRSILAKTKLEPFDLFTSLYFQSDVKYGAYLNLESFQVLSLSPELFISKKNSKLLTKPIKGTFSIDQDPKDIIDAPKESAELMMICDLMRNDLGRISHIGSVKCPEPKKLITLPHLYHLQSEIFSKSLNLHPIESLRKVFPPGSISGCPKLRAQEIIYQLEQRSRHIYTGSIGYISQNGDFNFNVAIRTAIQEKDLVEIQVGGAITIDSEPKAEFDETTKKSLCFMNYKKARSL